jgi:hypothetical protein
MGGKIMTGMIIGLFVLLGGTLLGFGLLIDRQIRQQNDRIDKLLKFIKPDVYRKVQISDDLQGTLFRNRGTKPEPTTIDKFMSSP